MNQPEPDYDWMEEMDDIEDDDNDEESKNK
jgi:hypothetical protein